MYIYDGIDERLVSERLNQFTERTRRYLAREIGDGEFRAWRLRNGLHTYRHAPMLRVAIPFGMMSSAQLRKLASISRRWDRAYVHFSSRQSVQLNWVRIEDAPAVMAELAAVQLHTDEATFSSYIHFTTDDFSGVHPNEVLNPLVWCEIIRQWSTHSAEFKALPRKFAIAVHGAGFDHTTDCSHDIVLEAIMSEFGIGFRVWVRCARSRSNIAQELIKPFVAWTETITYLQAILRVHQLHGEKSIEYKARIGALVRDLTPPYFAQMVEEQWMAIRGGSATITEDHVIAAASRFAWPRYAELDNIEAPPSFDSEDEQPFSQWSQEHVRAHRMPGYVAVIFSPVENGTSRGDITADQLEAISDLAERFSHGELRVSQGQNLILADVQRSALYELWKELRVCGLATYQVKSSTSSHSSPALGGKEFEDDSLTPILATARERLADLDYMHNIGDIELDISRCNDGPHGGIDSPYQVRVIDASDGWASTALSGNLDDGGSLIGQIVQYCRSQDQVPHIVERVLRAYVELRDSEVERFRDVVDRVGIERFTREVDLLRV